MRAPVDWASFRLSAEQRTLPEIQLFSKEKPWSTQTSLRCYNGYKLFILLAQIDKYTYTYINIYNKHNARRIDGASLLHFSFMGTLSMRGFEKFHKIREKSDIPSIFLLLHKQHTLKIAKSRYKK